MAMEMALFEGEERLALEGELEHLLEAWREAEEIAEISDNLIEPKGWEAFRVRVTAASQAAAGEEPPTVRRDNLGSMGSGGGSPSSHPDAGG
jgi:hypothetical protein